MHRGAVDDGDADEAEVLRLARGQRGARGLLRRRDGEPADLHDLVRRDVGDRDGGRLLGPVGRRDVAPRRARRAGGEREGGRERDGAAVHTLEAAQAKAYTSAAFGAATSELAPRAVGDGATVADLPGTLFLPGAVPVKIDGATIAGIGVGGAPDGMADEACAAAGLEALTGPVEG